MPRIKTTRTVTIALYLLRIYLLAMLLIILTKFIMEARGRGSHEVGAPRRRGKMPCRLRNLNEVLLSQLRWDCMNKAKSTCGCSHAKTQRRQ